MKIKAVLFDCDGVLLDSEYIFLQSLVAYLKRIGLKTTIEEMAFVLGKPAEEIVNDIMNKFSLHGKMSHSKLLAEERASYDEFFAAAKLETMPNLREFLDLLKAKQVKTALISSSRKAYLAEVVRRLNLEGYFDLIIGREDIKRGKPHPDIYLAAQEKLALAKEEALIIEDSVNGIKAGKNAGIMTVGYKGSLVKQDTSAADLEIVDFKELYPLFA